MTGANVVRYSTKVHTVFFHFYNKVDELILNLFIVFDGQKVVYALKIQGLYILSQIDSIGVFGGFRF